ncbi:MAG: cytochrome c oxidase subunit 3 [Flavobacteriales bacterium]|nr:cytochrome c oxidase subunit 3 [Flavobacteriales bacterium]
MIDRQKKKESLIRLATSGKLHPYQVMLYLGMAASGFLFLILTTMYGLQRFSDENSRFTMEIPRAFILSTLIMLGSSYTLKQAKQYFFNDYIKKSVTYLLYTLLLGFAFGAAQILGWIDLYSKTQNSLHPNVASSYVYVISGIHFFHVLFGLGYLLAILYKTYMRAKDLVAELIMVTNPFEKRKIDMLSRYWHYVDGLWLFLFLVFVLTF